MKKVVLTSLLAAAGAAYLPFAVAQQPAAPAAGGQGQVQMSQEEYNVYQAAVGQTNPAQKAAALEAYLKQYPNSAVKPEVMRQILFADSQTGDPAKTLDAADRLLAIEPNDLRALTFEVYYRRADADKMTDPAAKQAALDKVAGYAQQALNAPPPKGMTDAQVAATKQVFESAIADDDLAKKDNAAAITALKTELAGVPVAQTQTVGPVLQDEFTLANAYYTSNPPDYLNCAWYATRTANFAPDTQKPAILQLANYCYAKYHGSKDGFDKLQAMTQTNLNPPADLATTVTPAPKPEDMVKQLIATTPDLAQLALSDKEFVLQYGTKEDADKVFDSIKGKSVEIPGAVVVAATPDQLQVAVSDDAKNAQPKVADFTFAMKTPLTTLPPVGSVVNISGTYSSYTSAASPTSSAGPNPTAASGTAASGTTGAEGTAAAGSTTASGTAAAGSTTASGTAAAGSTAASGTAAAGSTAASGTTTGSGSTAAGQTPSLMIQMTDGVLVEPKKEAPKKTTPTRRPTTRRH